MINYRMGHKLSKTHSWPEIPAKIGVVGTGFIANGLILAAHSWQDICISKVLTRRNLAQCPKTIPKNLLTNSVQEIIDTVDLVVECSGDVIHSTEIISAILDANIPVVTMNSEFHVTTGSFFVGKGILTEAEGDQPGCLASFRTEVIRMGFRPLVFGNLKRFLNPNPDREDMKYWATKQGISLAQVTAFTDGTKVQIEQAFVANGLGATIVRKGLCGISACDVDQGAAELAAQSVATGQTISDYLLCPSAPAGVFIVAEHDLCQKDYLRYLKLGNGPYYVLVRPFHLCHLEILKTIEKVLTEASILLDNTRSPRISVAAITKRPLRIGDILKRGIGSFDVRGEAIKIVDVPDHVPIGLLSNAHIKRSIEPETLVCWDDVELPPSRALDAWQSIVDRASGHG